MLNILFLLDNAITMNLVLDCKDEFIDGITIPYFTYWAYFQIDVSFANPMQYLR